MKHMTASLAIGTCLLLALTGAVVAADPHRFTTSPTGQPGSNNGISCGGSIITTSGTITLSAPSGAVNGGGSPFNPDPTKPNGITYAGNTGNPTAQPGGVGNPAHAVSQYDVACFQASQVP